ncbi:hypothetical protein BDK51DRAFT_34953 [Blyttiomyces helicus]|uniref:Uncharacterized protein n=1 Tax=Blyttiomyces helicus TaxID=388810 RepID=A0A4P9WGQ1_9FUNG|nr:hypothetical protein BDK51DRAFT_34953 [Blyttiomyces helicus]|eukprot:RKO91884.1 hypothetical protein BDK51DRAFT_34953 [Blyttiomyces helicus]
MNNLPPSPSSVPDTSSPEASQPPLVHSDPFEPYSRFGHTLSLAAVWFRNACRKQCPSMHVLNSNYCPPYHTAPPDLESSLDNLISCVLEETTSEEVIREWAVEGRSVLSTRRESSVGGSVGIWLCNRKSGIAEWLVDDAIVARIEEPVWSLLVWRNARRAFHHDRTRDLEGIPPDAEFAIGAICDLWDVPTKEELTKIPNCQQLVALSLNACNKLTSYVVGIYEVS